MILGPSKIPPSVAVQNGGEYTWDQPMQYTVGETEGISGAEGTEGTEGTVEYLVGNNGLSSNGLPSNGLSSNGLPSNGLSSNGLPSNGLQSNGTPSNLFPNSSGPNAVTHESTPLETNSWATLPRIFNNTHYLNTANTANTPNTPNTVSPVNTTNTTNKSNKHSNKRDSSETFSNIKRATRSTRKRLMHQIDDMGSVIGSIEKVLFSGMKGGGSTDEFWNQRWNTKNPANNINTVSMPDPTKTDEQAAVESIFHKPHRYLRKLTKRIKRIETAIKLIRR